MIDSKLVSFSKGAMCGFTMDNYMVSEINGSVSVCVSLTGNVERSVVVTVFTLGGSAIGEYVLTMFGEVH